MVARARRATRRRSCNRSRSSNSKVKIKLTQEELNKILVRATPFDNELMTLMYTDPLLVLRVLQILLVAIGLSLDGLLLRHVEIQKHVKFGYKRKSLYFDVFAEDIVGRLFNIEFQRRTEDAPPDRLACHCAALRILGTEAGEAFNKLKDVFVIFFFENDPLKAGQPVVYQGNLRYEDNRPLGSHEHILCVNCDFRDTTTDLGKLIHDLFCSGYRDMLIPEMAEAMKYWKEKP